MERFAALLVLFAGNTPATGEFPPQRPVTRNFDVSVICALNNRLSKESWRWLFETPSRSSWRYCNVGYPSLVDKTLLHNNKNMIKCMHRFRSITNTFYKNNVLVTELLSNSDSVNTRIKASDAPKKLNELCSGWFIR